MVVVAEMTVAIVEDELPGICAYSQRHGWSVNWNAEKIQLEFLGSHPQSRDALRIVADVQDYRALPPAWTLDDPTGQRSHDRFFPMPGKFADGKSSVFHGERVICAHFNRRAYKQHGGPHGDWGGPASWLEFHNKGQVCAVKLAAMFAVIVSHLAVSEGMH